MTLVNFSAETGTNGTTLTTGNTGFSVVLGGALNTFATAAAWHGSLGYKFAVTSGTQDLGRIPPNATNTVMAFRGYVNFQTTPTVNRVVLVAQNSVRSAFNIFFATTKQLIIQDSVYANQVICTDVLSLSTWYRIEVLLSVGASSTTGAYTVNYYLGDSTTPVNSTPYTSTTYNLGTTALVGWDIGCNDTAATALTTYWDDVAVNDGATVMIGPSSSGTAGNVTAVAATISIAAPAPSVAGTSQVSGGGPGVITFTAHPAVVTGTSGPVAALSGSGQLTVTAIRFDPTIFNTVYGHWTISP